MLENHLEDPRNFSRGVGKKKGKLEMWAPAKSYEALQTMNKSLTFKLGLVVHTTVPALGR